MPINLSKYNIKNLVNKTYYQGENIKIFNYERKDNKMIKRKDMIKICKALQDGIKQVYGDGLISVSIQYPNRWYNGGISRLKEKINFFTSNDYDEFDEDPEQYQSFRFHFIPIVHKKEGGSDENNDCLINCIQKVIQTQKKLIDAAELKSILGLNRNDKISIDLIPTVEDYINRMTKMTYGINVSGDFEYISSQDTNKKINLILSKEHYILDMTKITKKCRKSHDEKPVVIVKYTGSGIETYDGNDYDVITREELDQCIKNPITSPYLIVYKNFTTKSKKLSIEEAYETYIEMADDFKKNCPKFNFYKCGSIKQMALNFFYEKIKAVQPEPINNNEALWIEDATHTATTYWEPYQGNVHSYDINSHYPSIMVKNFHYFPIAEGEYKTITKIEEIPEFGIYKCIVIDDGIVRKFFKFNSKNTYTNIDIEYAIKYNLKVELIQDGTPNFLYYSKDKLMNGAYLFKNYVHELYSLKKQKVKGAKDLLNVLWGGLCETNHKVLNTTTEMNITDARILSLHTEPGSIKMKFVNYTSHYYKTNWARIKPFILAYGRSKLYYSYSKYEDKIIRIHTDGFYITEKPTDIKLGEELGQLKYEGIKKVNITHLNKLNINI